MSLEIPIRAELNGLQSDLSKAVSVVSDAGEKFAQAADKASKRAAGGVDAILASGNSLKQQYRQLAREAVDLADKYGAMDSRAIKAAQAAGEIKDKIEDTNVVINAFKADSKFTVVAGAMQQAAGAASIVTGAMGLLGVKSEETQAMLLKVQSALALTQGLAQLKEMGAAFTALNAVLQTSVIPSLMTTQGLMIATGIGAVIAGVVALTMAASAYNDEIDKSIEKEKQLAENRKLDNEAYLKAVQNGLHTQELAAKAIQNKTDRELALIEISKQKAIQSEKEKFEASAKTYMDKFRLDTNIKNIEIATQNQITEFHKTEQDKRAKKNEETAKKAKELAEKQVAQQQKYNAIMNKAGEQYTDAMVALKQKEVDEALAANEKDLVTDAPEPIQVPVKVVMDKAAANEAFANLQTAIQKFKDFAIGAFTQLGMQAAYSLGQALTSEQSWGEQMKSLLANLMSTTAQALIALGAALAPVNPVLGGVIIGGAIALQIAAGALAGSAGGGGGASPAMATPTFDSGGMGGGNFGGGNGGGFGNFNMRTEGKDLVLAIQRQGQYNRRG